MWRSKLSISISSNSILSNLRCDGVKSLFRLIVFTFDHQTFCSLFKVRRHAFGCINNDVVIAYCSEQVIEVILLHPSRNQSYRSFFFVVWNIFLLYQSPSILWKYFVQLLFSEFNLINCNLIEFVLIKFNFWTL